MQDTHEERACLWRAQSANFNCILQERKIDKTSNSRPRGPKNKLWDVGFTIRCMRVFLAENGNDIYFAFRVSARPLLAVVTKKDDCEGIVK